MTDVVELNRSSRSRWQDPVAPSPMPMSEAIAAVVFDLDGVLVDSESVWDAARRAVVARNGGRWQADATAGDDGDEFTRVFRHNYFSVVLPRACEISSFSCASFNCRCRVARRRA